nr:hypothetical protein [Nocardia wallacei]
MSARLPGEELTEQFGLLAAPLGQAGTGAFAAGKVVDVAVGFAVPDEDQAAGVGTHWHMALVSGRKTGNGWTPAGFGIGGYPGRKKGWGAVLTAERWGVDGGWWSVRRVGQEDRHRQVDEALVRMVMAVRVARFERPRSRQFQQLHLAHPAHR